jgi:hypothetical protein
MGIPVGDLSPRGTGMRKKCSPQAFVGIPAGKFFRRGDGDGELFPGGEFPVAIPTLETDRWERACMHVVREGIKDVAGPNRVSSSTERKEPCTCMHAPVTSGDET